MYIIIGLRFVTWWASLHVYVKKGCVAWMCFVSYRRRPVNNVWVRCFSQFGKMCAIGMRGMFEWAGLVEIFVDKMAVAEL